MNGYFEVVTLLQVNQKNGVSVRAIGMKAKKFTLWKNVQR